MGEFEERIAAKGAGGQRDRERLGFWGKFKTERGREKTRGPLVENEGQVLSGQGEGLIMIN